MDLIFSYLQVTAHAFVGVIPNVVRNLREIATIQGEIPNVVQGDLLKNKAKILLHLKIKIFILHDIFQ